MKKKLLISLILLILLSTIIPKESLTISKFNIKKINIENNFLIKETDLIKTLNPIFNKNLIFLKNKELKKLLTNNDLIESYEIKKKYPKTLNIKIFEKKPIAILFEKKKKFYLSEKIDLIEFKNLDEFQNLPYIFGSRDKFKEFYDKLKIINFPFYKIKKFTLYETNRWDIQMNDNKVIRLPIKNFENSLENYLDLEKKSSFKKYNLFDYRIDNQLILK